MATEEHEKIHIRYATLEDFDAVMAIDENIFEGTDYLPSLYTYFVTDPLTKCYLLEINNEVVALWAGTLVDGGKSILGKGGRIKQQFRSKGYYQKMFGPICQADIMYHFPTAKSFIGASKAPLGRIEDIKYLLSNPDGGKPIYIFGKIVLRGLTRKLNSSSLELKGQNCTILSVAEAQLLLTMEKNRTILEPVIGLEYQPYEVTSANLKEIAERIKPVSFVSTNYKDDVGMSFHTSHTSKAGMVIYMCLKVPDITHVELHFKAHLKYILEMLTNGETDQFHIKMLFPHQLRFANILKIAFNVGFEPGVRDEGFLVARKGAVSVKPAKL